MNDDITERYEERAAIMEYEGGLPRVKAEALARAEAETYRASQAKHIASLPESQRKEYLDRVDLLRGVVAASELRAAVRVERMGKV